MKTWLRPLLALRYGWFHPKFQRFWREFREFSRLSRGNPRGFAMAWKNRYPMLDDRTEVTAFDPHYTYHPAWAARIIARTNPARHVDVSSTLHFCTMISAFVPVEFLDIRPAELTLDGLICRRGDLMNLPYADGTVESISCMHVVEHVGLGRYGDPLDPTGDLRAIAELKRVLGVGGSLLLVVPVGKPCIRFNAHRIYSYQQVMNEFQEFELMQFALIDDSGAYIVGAPPEAADAQEYGCGCWWFKK